MMTVFVCYVVVIKVEDLPRSTCFNCQRASSPTQYVCLNESQICDGKVDCLHGDDETRDGCNSGGELFSKQ